MQHPDELNCARSIHTGRYLTEVWSTTTLWWTLAISEYGMHVAESTNGVVQTSSQSDLTAIICYHMYILQ